MNQQPLNIKQTVQKTNDWIRNSLTIRLLTIGFLMLILLIPLEMVQGLISERKQRYNEVIGEVSAKWGHPQTIKGLILTIPYVIYEKVYDKKDKEKYELIRSTRYAHFLPDHLQIRGQINPEIRYRSIFEVVVYKSSIDLNGEFSPPDFDGWDIAEKDILWNDAFISLGLSDLRSIQEKVTLKWDGKQFAFNPGVRSKDIISSGISTRIPDLKSIKTIIPFSLKLEFNGSSSMNFIPLGKETNVSIHSSWKDPSFGGAFLPDHREINANGFKSSWRILHLNRSYPQQFLGSVSGINGSSFGVTLLMPVDQYQKSTRSAKYGFMVMALTFMVFFFVQTLGKIRIHPIQYLLVGFALCIFYTLLISISEHLNFQNAYLIASAATIILVTAYALSMFKHGRLTLMMAGILSLLYSFVFTVIQLQDYALLMGSIGLFLVLAVVMFISRKIDWYAQNT